MKRLWSLVVFVAAPAGLLFASGCGGAAGDMPDIGEVSGIVTLDDAPLPNADVLFVPETGRPSGGKTDDSGKYTLQYSPSESGAKVGKHVVRITTGYEPDDEDDPEDPAIPEILPKRYHAKTELTAEVSAGQNDIDFELKSN